MIMIVVFYSVLSNLGLRRTLWVWSSNPGVWGPISSILDPSMLQPVQNDATKNDQNFLRPSIPFIATQCQLYQPTQSKLMNLLRKKVHSLLVNVALTSNGMTCKLAAAMTRHKMVQLTRQQKRHFWRMPSGQLSHIPISNYALMGPAWWLNWWRFRL